MIITRYAFTPKASNRAKYGADAPRDGYINTWTEEVQADTPEEEEYQLALMGEEQRAAQAALAEWLKGGRMTARISLAMSQALDLLRAGHPPRVAAYRAGVNLTALYRAMRREGIGERCPHCGSIMKSGRAARMPRDV